MTNSIIPILTVLIGSADPSARPTAELAPGSTRWRITWTNPSGVRLQSIAALSGGSWSAPTPAEARLEASAPAGGLQANLLAWAIHGSGKLALRDRHRVPGVRPEFPSAGLVLSRAEGDGWLDLAYADDVPDTETIAAALCSLGDNVLGVYLQRDAFGQVVCRAFRVSLSDAPLVNGSWRHLPEYPLTPGVAGVLAGTHKGVFVAAGGANFPDLPPWEGGIKKYYDEIFVLPVGEKAWRPAGKLPEPRGYSAVLSLPEGILLIGGENATRVFGETTLLKWDGSKIVMESLPALPTPVANPVAAVLDGKIYLAGGYEAGPPRVSGKQFICLTLSNLKAGWQTLPSWPGPPRGQGVMAALGGALYLISGLELRVGIDGKTETIYLTDSYRYGADGIWETLPALPWSVLAAPSPAPVTEHPQRVFVLGGVDGRQVGKLPRASLVPEDIIYFDVAHHRWSLWPERWTAPVVTAPAFASEGEWILVSGETMAGKRTRVVQAWRPGTESQPKVARAISP